MSAVASVLRFVVQFLTTMGQWFEPLNSEEVTFNSYADWCFQYRTKNISLLMLEMTSP